MRKNNFLTRLKAGSRFIIYGKSYSQIMTCGKCGGQMIKTISQKPIDSNYFDENRHIDRYWSQFVQCLKCGAVCEKIQLWNFVGNPKEIDKDITVN